MNRRTRKQAETALIEHFCRMSDGKLMDVARTGFENAVKAIIEISLAANALQKRKQAREIFEEEFSGLHTEMKQVMLGYLHATDEYDPKTGKVK